MKLHGSRVWLATASYGKVSSELQVSCTYTAPDEFHLRIVLSTIFLKFANLIDLLTLLRPKILCLTYRVCHFFFDRRLNSRRLMSSFQFPVSHLISYFMSAITHQARLPSRRLVCEPVLQFGRHSEGQELLAKL